MLIRKIIRYTLRQRLPKAQMMNSTVDAQEMDGTTNTSLKTTGADTRLATNKEKQYRGDFKRDRKETNTKHWSRFLQDGKAIRMHMEDLPNSTNGYTMEEIYGRVYGRATKYDNSSRLKIRHMAKGNNDNW